MFVEQNANRRTIIQLGRRYFPVFSENSEQKVIFEADPGAMYKFTFGFLWPLVLTKFDLSMGVCGK